MPRCFLRDGLTLNPKYSLVRNIGLDGSGVHCEELDSFGAVLSDRPLSVEGGSLERNSVAYREIGKFLSTQSRAAWRVRQLIKKVLPWLVA